MKEFDTTDMNRALKRCAEIIYQKLENSLEGYSKTEQAQITAFLMSRLSGKAVTLFEETENKGIIRFDNE